MSESLKMKSEQYYSLYNFQPNYKYVSNFSFQDLDK